jgi:DNA helicase II / ATP-dependent DNA helicase PcrA
MHKQQFFNWIETNGFNLTVQQKEAVVHGNGPFLLLAVPGAGKTTVLIIRIAYLILVEGVNPERILCLTFGRAAAKEMKERFAKHFSDKVGNHFSTIHSFALEVMKYYFKQQGQNFQVIENLTGMESKTAVLRKIYENINGITLTDDYLEELQNAICFVKNNMGEPEEIEVDSIKNLHEVYEAYEKYKQSHRPRLIDYDDMLSIAYCTLQETPKLLSMYQERFDYIMTDESQDTSLLQHKIIELLARAKGNIFILADDDQSIFGFRAAEPEYLLSIEKVYEQAKILRIEQNFRSTPQIINIAREFIRTNKIRYDKNMFTENPAGEPIKIGRFNGVKEQNEFVLQQLKTNKDLTNMAVLYRNNLSAICLVEELDRGNIPFYMRESSKDRFFSHWAIKDILNFLRFSFSDKNFQIFEKIWSKFESHMSKQHLDMLRKQMGSKSIFDLLADRPNQSHKQKKYFEMLKSDFEMLKKLPPQRAIQVIRVKIGYDKAVTRMCDSLGFSEEYVNNLLGILETIASREKSVVEFAKRLEHIQKLIENSYKNKGTNAVTLSTIHSAKGLEWEKVYMIDLVEGIIPNSNSPDIGPFGLEEERRLFYVGMTRAKRELTLCSLDYYQKSMAKDSLFVKEVSLLLDGKDPVLASNEDNNFGQGLLVVHKTLGRGVITKEEGNMLTIKFDDGKERILLKDMCEKQKLLKAM